jgi:hypothetical protein
MPHSFLQWQASIVALTVFAVGGALCFKPSNAGDKIASAT